MQKELIIYSGYANSRKTNTINPILRDLGYTVLSTSDILSEVVDNFFSTFFGTEFDGQLKEVSYSFNLDKSINGLIFESSYTELSRRDLKIKFAEDILVKTFGRQIFPSVINQRVCDLIGDGALVAIETIGGKELDLILKPIHSDYIKYYGVMFNARSKDEKHGVDIRELIDNVTDVYTDNYIACYEQLKSLVMSD